MVLIRALGADGAAGGTKYANIRIVFKLSCISTSMILWSFLHMHRSVPNHNVIVYIGEAMTSATNTVFQMNFNMNVFF